MTPHFVNKDTIRTAHPAQTDDKLYDDPESIVEVYSIFEPEYVTEMTRFAILLFYEGTFAPQEIMLQGPWSQYEPNRNVQAPSPLTNPDLINFNRPTWFDVIETEEATEMEMLYDEYQPVLAGTSAAAATTSQPIAEGAPAQPAQAAPTRKRQRIYQPVAHPGAPGYDAYRRYRSRATRHFFDHKAVRAVPRSIILTEFVTH